MEGLDTVLDCELEGSLPGGSCEGGEGDFASWAGGCVGAGAGVGDLFDFVRCGTIWGGMSRSSSASV